MKTASILTATALSLALIVPDPAMAKKDEIALAKCDESLGTIAVVDGDTQGWSEYGLGSPRELINSLAIESGCFTPQNAASGAPADFLMNVVAGDSEEVDKSIEMAKGAAMEGLWRSGAATSVLSKARQVIKDKQIAVDPQRWQCCMTDELLTMIQAGHENEALDLLMDLLLGKDSNGKCSNVAECVDGGCQIRNTQTVNVELNLNGNQDRMAQTAGD